MDKEKVVVTLLLITIILSLVSVIVTFSVGDKKVDSGRNTVIASDPDDTASVSLVVQPSSSGGAG
ncbi:hypothetical protein HYT23_01300 [Candidatus Pacearchaeota archaeon]|nr:hypothetical protein [Candidatus Pacearchaeota archaeon]